MDQVPTNLIKSEQNLCYSNEDSDRGFVTLQERLQLLEVIRCLRIIWMLFQFNPWHVSGRLWAALMNKGRSDAQRLLSTTGRIELMLHKDIQIAAKVQQYAFQHRASGNVCGR